MLLIFVHHLYAMITGDKTLSPNNIQEIKMLTSESNLNGENVRVVLISQAGSEGLDLKFIRQVHILDPWYNMNRIEQIIGRAVRTCSHKDLPFIKRNVQIFLHGTILKESREEAADLYIYRLAEIKAIQIGEVSRVLKQSAVDCLLNTKQTEFTPKILNQVVKQELSNKQVIDYQIGDKPYSAICDYMETCQYICKPDVKILEKDVTLDTYNEDYIMMNTDKIIRRIRMLFKERFFYTKSQLVKHINIIHVYPEVQINAALTQLIDDNYEYITDKYGRVGRLINIAELYLYQPLELTDFKASSRDRSVPIPYKHKEILFNIKEKIPRPQISIQKEPSKIVEKPKANDKLLSLWNEMINNYEKSITEQHILRGEKDWYILASSIVKLMNGLGEDKEQLREFIVQHILESLLFDDTLLVLNELDNNSIPETPIILKFKEIAKRYYEKLMIRAKNIKGLFLYNDKSKTPTLIIKELGEDVNNEWKIGEKEDEEDLKGELSLVLSKVLPIKEKMGEVVGFMAIVKNQYYIFKIKETMRDRHKGARCDQSGKKEANKLIQLIFSIKNIALDVSSLHQLQICILQELYLRLLDKNQLQGKKWFLNPTEVLFAIR